MKFSQDASVFLPFLNLGQNLTNSDGFHNSSAAVVVAPTAITSSVLPLATHHHHHHHGERGPAAVHEPHHTQDENGVFRPIAGEPKLHIGRTSALEDSQSCPTPPVVSCSVQAQATNACCVVTPGGVLVHAQFWDLNIGVADSWGIHGLWPDNCDNSYLESCDSSREYSAAQITSAITNSGQTALLDYMNKYYLSDDESPSDFWQHEWSTHGTCVSTLEPSCFENYVTAQEVVPYFSTIVAIFKQLDTYSALSAAEITPSTSKTYTLAEMQSAVEKATGYTPDFVCSSDTLTTVEYYLNAAGPLQDGSFQQSHASRSSTCPSSGIKYPPKQLGGQSSN